MRQRGDQVSKISNIYQCHNLNLNFYSALCQNKDGGFGGGPGQISHLATTYAAVNALAIMGKVSSDSKCRVVLK